MDASIFISGLFHLPIVCKALTNAGLSPVIHSSYPKFRLKKRLTQNCEINSYPRKEVLARLPNIFFKDKPLALSHIFQRNTKKSIERLDSALAIGWAGHSLDLLVASEAKNIPVILERGSTHIIWQRDRLLEAYDAAGIRPNMKLIPTEAYIEAEMLEYEKASLIHVPSQFCADSFAPYLDKKAQRKIRITRYGFDLPSPTHPRQTAIKNRPLKIGFAGTLSVRKGFFDYCWLANEIDAKQATFEAVGRQDEDSKTILKLYKAPFIPESSISRIGLLDRLSEWDILILPSFEEGLAMIIPEALSQNTVVIASDVSGASEYIENGKTGFIFEHGNRQELKEIVSQLVDSPEKVVDIQQGLLENNRQESDAQHYLDTYADSIRELLGSEPFNDRT